MEFFQGKEICGDIFADGSVGTPAGFHGADTFRRECLVTNKKFTVFPGEDVVGDGSNVHSVPQFPAERQHERGFATANRAADTNRKGTARQVTTERLVAVMKMSRVG